MSTNSIHMTICKFDGANYNKWSGQVELLLEAKHVLGIVTGDLKKPDSLGENATPAEKLAHSTLLETYVDKHGTARSTLLLTMEERLQVEYIKFKDAKGLWDQLAADYKSKVKRSKFRIRKELLGIKLEDCGDVATYTLMIDRLVQDWNLCIDTEVDTVTKDDTMPAERRRTKATIMPDGEHIFYLLYGIPSNDDWNIFLEFMEDKNAEDTMWPSDVITKMLERETKLKHEKGLGSDTLLFAKKTKGKKGQEKKATESSGEKKDKKVSGDGEKTCHHCQKKGHVIKNCHSKKRGDAAAPKPDQRKNSDTAATAAAATETVDNFWMALPSGAHTSISDWYVDGGCTTHICGDRAQFSHYTAYSPGSRKVKGFNNEETDIAGFGEVRLVSRLPDGRSEKIVLQNVLHQPGSFNLISQSTLMDKDVCIETINHYGLNIYNPHGKLIATAPQIGGLFVLDRDMESEEPKAALADGGDVVGSLARMDSESCLVALKTTGQPSKELVARRILWHRRLAHVGLKALDIAPTVVEDMPKVVGKCECDSCIKGKNTRKPFTPVTTRASAPLELIHADICGPVEGAIGGGRYMLLFIDDHTRWTSCFILSRKSEAMEKFQEWLALAEKTHSSAGYKVKRFRSDGGGEFTSKTFAEYLKKEGIAKETTTPYTPQSNGVVERANRTIFGRARSMLDDAGLSKLYWAFAVEAAVYLKNRTPTRSVIGMTPFEAWHGIKPSVKHIRVFGCLAFVHVPKEKRLKLDFRATPVIFVGYGASTKQYLVYDPLARALHRSRDVIFREDRWYKAPNAADQAILSEHFYREEISDRHQSEWKDKYNQLQKKLEAETLTEADSGESSTANVKEKLPREMAGLKSTLGTAWNSPTSESRHRRAPVGALADSYELAAEDSIYDEQVAPLYAAIMINTSGHQDGIEDPKSYKAATESTQAAEWDDAMKTELKAIVDHQVFDRDFVELPAGRKALPSHWVYKVKRDGTGMIQKFKARLVIGGNHQVEGVDYTATYAPTARLGHVRLALAIAAKYNLELHQMDVCTAFLGVDLDEEIYMHPPQGYYRLIDLVDKSLVTDSKKDSRVLVMRLRKSLYGLKQSSNVWYGAFKSYITSIGFEPSRVDGGVFVRRDEGEVTAVIVLFVDDLLILGQDIADIKDNLAGRFRMHDLGDATFYLGMSIERNRDNRTVEIHQHAFLDALLNKYGMQDAKAVSTPMSLKLHKRTSDEEPCDKQLYQSMVGSLMYLMTASRPDLAFSVGVLSRFCSDPSKEHMVALKRVFRYLKGTRCWKLRLGGEGPDESRLDIYVDSDYAGDKDDFRSTSGMVVTFGGAIDWRSRKQRSTAQSTTDAEYYSFGAACMRITHLMHLMEEIGIEIKPVVYTDSQSMLASVKNRIFRGTEVAHIATKFHLAADMVRENRVGMEYIPTTEMVADALTKALPKPAFLEHCRGMGLITE